MVCKLWMNGLAIENSCITMDVYRGLNKSINQSITLHFTCCFINMIVLCSAIKAMFVLVICVHDLQIYAILQALY